MTIPILVYTHSEYSFLWKAAIPLLEKYANGFEIIWCCDSILDVTPPQGWRVFIYDTNLSWSMRIKSCLDTINSDYVIHLQEDWLLIDSLSKERIEYCIDFMKKYSCEFLVSLPWKQENLYYDIGYDGYRFIKVDSHYLQPAIWKKSLLDEFCLLDVPLRDAESEKCFSFTRGRNCFATYTTKYPKDVSTRSFLFPHIHAIYQGKWTFIKYPCLKALVESYGIDTTTRGVDNSWIIEYQ
jgi:hypothetical protein